VDACADPAVVRAVAARREQTVCISGLTGEGLPELLERVSAKLQDSMVAVHVLIPYSQGDLVDEIHRTGVVEATEFGAAGTEVRAWVPLALAQRLQPLRAAAAERAEAAGVGAAAAAAAEEAGIEADGEVEADSDGWEEWEEELSSEEEAAEEGQQLAAGKAA
jgi:GTP-binding protein HflX